MTDPTTPLHPAPADPQPHADPTTDDTTELPAVPAEPSPSGTPTTADNTTAPATTSPTTASADDEAPANATTTNGASADAAGAEADVTGASADVKDTAGTPDGTATDAKGAVAGGAADATPQSAGSTGGATSTPPTNATADGPPPADGTTANGAGADDAAGAADVKGVSAAAGGTGADSGGAADVKGAGGAAGGTSQGAGSTGGDASALSTKATGDGTAPAGGTSGDGAGGDDATRVAADGKGAAGAVGGGEKKKKGLRRVRLSGAWLTVGGAVVLLVVFAVLGYVWGLGPMQRLNTNRAINPPAKLAGLDRITDKGIRDQLQLDQTREALSRINNGKQATVEAYGTIDGSRMYVIIALRGKVDIDKTVADAGATPDKIKHVGNSTCVEASGNLPTQCYRGSNTLTVIAQSANEGVPVDQVAPVAEEAFKAMR
ncbi:hypothetical protein ACQHIV_18305 [Kribbella sp. GL6]|uniref:hypothetical protein n=1 Tax=Kribbella sp. GL6 TaxID=3419765 RepID=UPI003D0616A1